MMRRLINYKGLLILWTSTCLLLYSSLIIFPTSNEWIGIWDRKPKGGLFFENYNDYKKAMNAAPFITLAGVILIGGIGYLISKK